MKLKITPDMAKAWMQEQVNFRCMDRARVRQYARDIASGKWAYNGESIKFNSQGKMFDGQHRCAAIIESGCTIVTEVIEGIEDESGVDGGKVRSPADYLRADGFKNAAAASAAAGLLVKYAKRQLVNTGFRVSHAMILDMLDMAPSIIQVIGTHKCQGMASKKTPLRNLCGHVFRYMILRADQQKGSRFWHALSTGELIEQETPVWLLREYMLACSAKSAALRPDSRHILALSIKAWNAHCVGKKLKNLTWRRGGESSEDFPRVYGFEVFRSEREDAFTFVHEA